MRLLRKLNQEDTATLTTLSEKESLIKDDCDHGNCYYGVEKEPNKEDIKVIERILNESIDGFISFCNFTSKKKIRFLYNYDYNCEGYFSGVGYVFLEDVCNGEFARLRREDKEEMAS